MKIYKPHVLHTKLHTTLEYTTALIVVKINNKIINTSTNIYIRKFRIEIVINLRIYNANKMLINKYLCRRKIQMR